MTTCLLCARDRSGSQVVGLATRGGRACVRIACRWCGMVQHAEPPSSAELARYYRDDYRRENGALPQPWQGHMAEPGTPEHEASLDDVAAGRVELVALATSEMEFDLPPNVLEVGCGDGRTAAQMIAAGADVLAVEIDPGQRALAQGRGVPVTDAIPIDVRRRVDVSCAFHSLEHHHDPVALLAQMRRATRVGGRIAIEVPNVEAPYGASLDGWYWQWGHVVDFSSRTLHAALLAAGWVDVETVVQGHVLVALGTVPADDLVPPPREVACEAAGADAKHADAIVAGLERWSEVAEQQAALRELLEGGEDTPLRHAVLGVLREGQAAAQVVDETLGALGRLVVEMERVEGEIDHERESDQARGYQAGKSAAYASISQSIAYIANAAKAREWTGGAR